MDDAVLCYFILEFVTFYIRTPRSLLLHFHMGQRKKGKMCWKRHPFLKLGCNPMFRFTSELTGEVDCCYGYLQFKVILWRFCVNKHVFVNIKFYCHFVNIFFALCCHLHHITHLRLHRLLSISQMHIMSNLCMWCACESLCRHL